MAEQQHRSALVMGAVRSVVKHGDILAIMPESFEHLIRINLRQPFFLAQAAARRMVETPSDHPGTMVTISKGAASHNVTALRSTPG